MSKYSIGLNKSYANAQANRRAQGDHSVSAQVFTDEALDLDVNSSNEAEAARAKGITYYSDSQQGILDQVRKANKSRNNPYVVITFNGSDDMYVMSDAGRFQKAK